MKFTLLVVGKGMPEPIARLVEEYSQRLQRHGGVTLVEVAETRRSGRSAERPGERRLSMEREGERLLRKVPAEALVVPLDAGGRSMDSAALAATLRRWREGGARHLCLVIGGPDGLPRAFLERYPFHLSLGPMTFPHMLVRVMILEQLYRAVTILEGIPYHR